MGTSVSKPILDLILGVAVPVLDDILQGLGEVPALRRFFDKRALGDAQGDYTQIYHKSLNDVINHFYSAYGYQYNGPASTPPHAIDSTIFGFEDFCLYDPNDQVASNISGYLSNAFQNKGFAEADVNILVNALVGDIRQMYANQNTNWQYHDRNYQLPTSSNKTAEIDLSMLYTNFSMTGDGDNVVMFIAFGAVYYHVQPFEKKKVIRGRN